ncbi:MAG TPA: hypothetical protein VK586_06320 [Streptosporangiaceae bacterium]|nr:hypothetical protein [Streptosporangiaceae bacterium]
MTDIGRVAGEPQPAVGAEPPLTTAAQVPPAAEPRSTAAQGPVSAARGGPSSALGGPSSAPGEPSSAPGGPSSAPGGPSSPPGGPSPAPGGPSPAPGEPSSAPRGPATEISVEQAIALRDHAPEIYDLWLRIAQEKAATASYVERAPYEVPERLAQAGRPRALGALVIVLSFCGYLAWLGGPGPYIGGLIAILDLGIMFGMFFGLRPERLPDAGRLPRR